MSPRIILNADDFGLHPALNEGIERAHRYGLVTSASIMPVGNAFEDAARRWHSLPHLDLGLHFALVGVPGAPATLGRFFAASLGGEFPAREIAGSLRRQLDLAVRVHRLPISHIDSHQHLHAWPPIMRVVCTVAREYGIPAIRLPIDGPPRARVAPARRLQAALLRAMARLSRHYLTASHLRTTDSFAGMAVSGHLTPRLLASYLRRARPGITEIVCHPGASNGALGRAFQWGYDWEGELAALCDPGAHAYVETGPVQLANWRSV